MCSNTVRLPYSLSVSESSGDVTVCSQAVAVCFNIVWSPYRNIRQHHRILQSRKVAVLLVQSHGWLCSVQGRMVGHVTCLDVLWSTWAALDWRVEKLKINGIKIKIVNFEVLLFLSLNPTFWRKVTFLDKTYSDRNQFKFQTPYPAGRPVRRLILVIVGYIVNRPRTPVDSNLLVSSLKVYY